MPLGIPLVIQGIELLGVNSNVIAFIQGSTLDHQRYLSIWAVNGYDVQNSDFLRWLFGVNGNNTQRAGALTVDMLNGHELILMESSVWKTGSGSGSSTIGTPFSPFGSNNNILPAEPLPTNPATIIPIVWIILGAIAVYFQNKKTSATGGYFS